MAEETYESLGYNNLLTKERPNDVINNINVGELLTFGAVAFDRTTLNKLNPKEDVQTSNFVTGSTGWRIQGNGDVEFNSGTFRGTLEAGSIHIPDENTTANSFHVETDGDSFWGCTQSDFTTNNNNANAYILKTGAAKFQDLIVQGGNIIGSTITGGTLQTATSGARIVITGNDITLYDDSTGGSSPVTGNTASIVFDRTDGNNGTFLIQKRETIHSSLGNAIEMFYSDVDAGGALNYIFIGREGKLPTVYSDYKNHVFNATARDLVQLSSGALHDNKSGYTVDPGPEIQIQNSDWPTGTQFDTEGSRVLLGAVNCTSDARYDPTDGSGGAAVLIGVQQDLGFYIRLTVDNTGIWTWGNITPEGNADDNLGSSTLTYDNVYAQGLRIYSSTTSYGTIDDAGAYFNFASVNNRNIRIQAGTGSVFISAASIAPLSSGVGSCGLSSNYWSNVYTNNITLNSAGGAYINYTGGAIKVNTTFTCTKMKLPVGTNLY